ncbi:hypothetical protein B7P43_G12685 [Cryptotermes secundus]|uniref:MOXD1-like protein 2 n=1 Tax=Cryptotermes secundus TaxID=105785 RepID=A0A2J7RF08_9NEOP|nr:hypothetical protein B7P43_G12685 [Cryptotermes secundus]
MNKSRSMKCAGHVARMGETRNAYRILVGKPEGKRLQGRPRRRWVDNIRMNLGEIGWDGMDWIDLAEGRDQWRALVNTVTLPASEETLCWCKIFRLPYIRRKHHMVRYVPLREPVNRTHVHRVIVYECQGSEAEFEVHAKERGQVCYQSPMPPIFFNCNNVVIAWGIGSEGFTFPPEAGYPLDPDLGPKYFMMETHYNNSVHSADNTGTSGMRVYYTASLRRHDAGVLSVGMDPNWRHIIPPGQPEVVSEGHCISTCTWQAFPPRGIKVFAAALHMHLIGRRIRLRQIRNGVELPPIAADNNYDPGYQEYRRLLEPVQVYRGDHLIAQCVYNSEGRTTITLGGLTSREEMCLVFAMYYPRIDLSLCHSLPSLPTVLHSLGIQELWPDSSPVTIKSPPELADMTLESRLVTYDWENHFRSFQEATRKGSFKPLCWMKKPTLLPVESYLRGTKKPYGACALASWNKVLVQKLIFPQVVKKLPASYGACVYKRPLLTPYSES